MKIKNIYNQLITEQKEISFSVTEDLELNDTMTIKGLYQNKVFGHITILFEMGGYWKFEDEMSEERYDELFPDDRFATIEVIDVNDAFKGKGFAKYLMLEAFKYIKKEGENVIYLNASPIGFSGLGLTSLVNFYKSFGFKIIVDDYSENKEMIKYI